MNYEYWSHPVILQTKQIYKQTEVFGLPKVNPADLDTFINSLNPNKNGCSEGKPPKLFKTAANTIGAYNTNILSNDISKTLFPEETNTAYVTIIYKKGKREEYLNSSPTIFSPMDISRRRVSQRHSLDGQFPDWQFPDRQFTERTVPRMDSFPKGYFPGQTFSRLTYPWTKK